MTAYFAHIHTAKTAKSAQTDIYYLRDMFGPVCDALKITSRKPSAKAKKKPSKAGVDARTKAPVMAADSLEAKFISTQVARRGLAPKTANRYREILTRLFNWSVKQGVRLPRGGNPAAEVERYTEPAPTNRFLTLEQIDEQLDALADELKYQAMVATLIYAGLRREELLWLTPDYIDWSSGQYGIIRVRAKTVNGVFWQPKTKVNRAVPISSRLRHYHDKWRLKRSNGAWFFPNAVGGRYDPDNFSSDLRALNKAKSKALKVPKNLTLLHLPPYLPELNPVERVWAYMRSHYLSNRVFKDYNELFDVTAAAWNRLDETRLKSICHTAWIERAN